MGNAFFDPRVHDAKGLIVWLMGGKEGLHDGVLHLKLEKPVVKWSVGDTEGSDFADRIYGILKEWLRLERWNRRYFRAGVAREILWETNEMPKVGDVVHTWTPAHGRAALADIEPLVRLLGLHARHHPELWTAVHAAEKTLHGRDELGIRAGLRHDLEIEAMFRLADIAKEHPTADMVAIVRVLRCDAEGANFWLHCSGRGGHGSGNRHEGTWEELRQKGFDNEIKLDGPNSKVTLSFARYFANTPVPYELIEEPQETPTLNIGDFSPCLFLRRLPPKTAEEPESGTQT